MIATFTNADKDINGIVRISHGLSTDLLDVTVKDSNNDLVRLGVDTDVNNVYLDLSKAELNPDEVWKVLIEKS